MSHTTVYEVGTFNEVIFIHNGGFDGSIEIKSMCYGYRMKKITLDFKALLFIVGEYQRNKMISELEDAENPLDYQLVKKEANNG